MILNMNWQMLQKVTKCYFEPLPQLSYIYWFIHFKTEYLLDNVWPFKNSYFVPCLLNIKCRCVSWNGTVTSDIRHFVYLNHVLVLTNDEPVKNLYYQQLQLVFEEKWANKIHGWFWWKRLKQVYEFFFNFQVCHNNFLYLKTHPIEDWELQHAQFFWNQF